MIRSKGGTGGCGMRGRGGGSGVESVVAGAMGGAT